VPVRVLYVGRGLEKAEIFGPHEVAERYGVPAARAGAAYAELAVLRGDPSDGLPGVAGVGEKTASRLLLEYGSLRAVRDAVSDRSSDLGNTLRTKLSGGADYLDAALPVVQVVCDGDVEMSRDDLLPAEPVDSGELDALAAQWGVASSVRRLREAMTTVSR